MGLVFERSGDVVSRERMMIYYFEGKANNCKLKLVNFDLQVLTYQGFGRP